VSFLRPRSWTQWVRRLCQAVFLLLFVWTLVVTHLAQVDNVPPLLRFYFQLDPLVLTATWLSSHAVPAALLVAFITVGVTLLLGRVFCGWFCPFGTLHNIFSWLRSRRETPTPPETRSPWQRAKYIVLIALLVMALFGVHWIGVLDPFSFLYRSGVTAVLPAIQYGVEDASTAIYVADPKIGPFRATSVSEPVYRFLRDQVFRAPGQAFYGSIGVGILFVAVLVLNWVKPRFWCRYICPLGALLGVLAQRPVMRLRNEESLCNNCGKCSTACPAAAQPDKRGDWLPTECFGCWNCVAACNFKAISFEFRSPFPRPAMGRLDLSRRTAVQAALAGVTGIFLMRLTPQAQEKNYNPELIRPPGALRERQFLQKCIQCGLCMRVCPTTALHPCGFESGLEGLWTPRLIPKIGYCEYNCNLCGQVCPTGAIQSLALEEKQQVKLGLATIDTTRCLPYAYGRSCIICEEHCPVPQKAIYLVEREVRLPNGKTTVLKQPQVDPDRCIGCGMCENVCVFSDRAAIRITSANESRNSDNQPILPMAPESSESTPYGS